MSHGHGHGHDHGSPTNKRIAIFISILALCLAIAETLGKSAQTNSISANVEASNLWAFYQAKTIRMTSVQTAADQMDVDIQLAKDPEAKKLLEKRVADWRATAKRYDDEPKAVGTKGQGSGAKA
jgi:altronate dehydratase